MRITVYCPHYEALGGVREVARRIGVDLIGRGHGVSFVSRISRAHRGVSRRRPSVDPATGAELWRTRLLQAPHRSSGLRAYRRFARRFPVEAIRLVRMARSTSPDVIATHCSKFHAPYILVLRIAACRRIVVHLHNAERTADGPESIGLTRLMLRSAERVIAVSPAVADYARRCLPARADRVVTVPNGIDTEELAAVAPVARPCPYVLGVGRLARQKGFDILIEAFALAGLKMDLVLAGAGPDRQMLIELAARHDLGTRVHFLGEVERATVIGLVRGASVVAAPSRFEGHPLVHMEAMAAGAPVVASSIPGVPAELRDGETGLLVPAENAPALAAALRSLANAPERARALGDAARVAARSFPSWGSVAERVLAVYESARPGTSRDHTGDDHLA